MSDELPLSWPDTAADMVAIAYQAIERYETTEKSALNLMSAVLVTSHVADWYGRRDQAGPFDIREFGQRYPEFPTIRKLANAMKHPSVRDGTVTDGFAAAGIGHGSVAHLEMEWEDRDFWIGQTAKVLHLGQERPITGLCRLFLNRFEAELRAEELDQERRRTRA